MAFYNTDTRQATARPRRENIYVNTWQTVVTETQENNAYIDWYGKKDVHLRPK